MKSIIAVIAALVVFTVTVAHADKVLYVTDAGDTTVVATLSDVQVFALESDLLSVTDWISDAIEGKVSNCKSRMISKWMPYLQVDSEVLSIPKGEDALIKFIVDRSYYMDRATEEVNRSSR